MKITAIILVMFCLYLGMPGQCDAAMSSTNYQITTTVMSGGGEAMVSSNYALTGTLGQPSPLIDDPLYPPFSLNYEMLTGFWYTLGGSCRWDIEPIIGDGDVDGADLYEFINAFDPADVLPFANEFGSVGCQ